ncbi:unnamed protein product [Psylliodes chrysocephalus]|uniref:FLYWCH-type domain-containing protein n=1 Tax=Psylliodes chrysocephalus TaxID=3402493 RepID=A0A9P0CTH1_9CUCU|nr:unnamed protein product [Psylliodes chrysocephala]
MEFVLSEKVNRKLVINGFIFVKDEQVDSKIYWKCEYFHKYKCRAQVITDRDGIQKGPGEHNHIEDAARLEVTKLC